MIKPVYHLILINGEHLLATIVRKNKDSLILKDPFLIDEYKNYDTGQSSLLLNQYTNSEENAVISKSHVIVSTVVNNTVANYYRTFVKFNELYTSKNKYSDMAKVTNVLQQTIEDDSKKVTKVDENLIVFKETIDIKQLYVPTSNTIN